MIITVIAHSTKHKKDGQYYPRKNVNTHKETQQKTQACD
jgi:hypothetical protein